MKTLICKLRRHHDWKVWPSDDDRCETCGLFRLWPSGDIVRMNDDGLKVVLYGNKGDIRSSAMPERVRL